MFFRNKKICFIGAHPDDIELGCGALISNIIGKSNDILCLTLSKNQNNPNNADLIEEQVKSLTSLNVPKGKIIVADFITRLFSSSRQEICDYLLSLNKEYQPDIIFTHSFFDMHQDHEVVSKEVLRIFKQKTIIGFDIPPSSYNFRPNFFFEVSEKDVKNKLMALINYKTYKNKNYFSKDVICAQLIKNGVQMQKRYAEAFDIIRLSYAQ